MLFFPMEFGRVNHRLSSVIPAMELRKILLLSPYSVLREAPLANNKITVANGQLETTKSTIELNLEVGEFHSNGKPQGTDKSTIILPEKSYSPGYEARPSEVPLLPIQLKTADH